jgi:hypothetical protein
VTSAKLADSSVTSSKLDTNIAISGNLTVDTNTLYVDSANNRVGIGTSSSANGLTVQTSGTQWTGSTTNTYAVPAGNVFIHTKGTSNQDNWIGITGGYGGTSGSSNILLQANLNNINQQAGNYIGSEAISATSADLTFGKMVGGAVPTTTNATKSEHMRIASNGNVGIGTSSPYSKLSIFEGNVNQNYTSTQPLPNSTITILNGNNRADLSFVSKREDTAQTQNVARIEAECSGGWVSKLHFYTANNWTDPNLHAMTLSSNRVGIRNTNPTQILEIGSTAAYFTASGSGDQFILRANGVNNNNGYFYYNSSNNYGTTSDSRIKNNITPIDKDQALSYINSITPSSFSIGEGSPEQIGFIAQDLLENSSLDLHKSVVQNHETYDANDPDSPLLGVSDRPLVSLLVASLQKQQELIQALETRIQALENN